MTNPTVLVAPHALRHRSGRARERLGTVPGSLLGASRPLLARPGRPKIDPGPALARPGRVPNAPRRVPETAFDAQNRPRAIFLRFFVHLAWFFRGFSIDFSLIFEGGCTNDRRIWATFLSVVLAWVPPFLIAVVGAVQSWLAAVLA